MFNWRWIGQTGQGSRLTIKLITYIHVIYLSCQYLYHILVQILNSVRANAATKDGMIADKDRRLNEQESRITDLISQREAALVERDALLQVL